jgi:histidine triad (HIT) family protein
VDNGRSRAVEGSAGGAALRHCIFCRIAAGEVHADLVNQDEHFVAFPDARPRAPVHLLVVPRRHVASLDQAEELGPEAAARALAFIAATARSAGVADSGYRVIVNTGPDAGQEVQHLHWHVIGGTRLGGMV